MQRRLAQLLLACFLLLNLLVEEAEELPRGLQEKEHHQLWVLLQVQPRIISGALDIDIFTSLTQLLQRTSIEDSKFQIHEQYQTVNQVLPKLLNLHNGTYEPPPLFCILDEAQVAATLHCNDFMSSNYSNQCPVL